MQVASEMKRYKIEVLGVNEVRRNTFGCKQYDTN